MYKHCVVHTANHFLVCAILLGHVSLAVQASDLAQCTAKSGEPNTTVVECTRTLLGAASGKQSKRLQATFVFIVGDELVPILQCRTFEDNPIGISVEDVDANNCTVGDEVCTCDLGQAGTSGCSYRCGYKKCECRRRFGVQLVHATLEHSPEGEVSSNRETTPPGMAAFLAQVKHIDISFSANSSKNLIDICSPAGVLETSPMCNLTTWESDCQLTVSFNACELEAGSSTPATYSWTSLVSDLRLQGSVESLHISGDQHTMVKVMDALEALNLEGTKIICLSNVEIPDCSFRGITLSSLQLLNISHSKLPDNCSFMHIDADGLKTLILHNDTLSSVPRRLPTFTKLESLDLSMNEQMVLKDVEGFKREINTWGRLGNMRSLSFSYVILGSLSVLRNLILQHDGTECAPISNITELRLSGCRIQDLEDENFYQCLSSLTQLDLSHNLISSYSLRIFHKLKKIKFLSLSYNDINSLSKMELHNETSLDIFDLSHNNISLLRNFLDAGSTALLDLSFNKIVEWNKEEMFCRRGTYVTWTDHLNLSYNSLKTVTRVMGDSLLVLSTVDLRGNKFDCSDCNTTEFQKWLMKTKVKYERLSVFGTNAKDVICDAPKALAGQYVVNILIDTAHCATAETQNFFVYVVLPLALFMFSIAAIGSVLAYKYRFELAYVRYYWSIKTRKKSSRITENGEYEFDAFVSYSRHDRAWVLDELMVHLEMGQAKYKLCLHERDFLLGSLILENIESSMRKSRYTLVVLSRGFVESQWCRWELEMANYKLFDSRREFLVLLQLEYLERKEIPRHLKYLIETRTYLEWPGHGRPNQQATFWRRLMKALGESLHQRQQIFSASPASDMLDYYMTETLTTTNTTTTPSTTTTTTNTPTTKIDTAITNNNDRNHQATKHHKRHNKEESTNKDSVKVNMSPNPSRVNHVINATNNALPSNPNEESEA